MNTPHYFGTDGIRAPVDSPSMTPEFMHRLGWASGTVLLQNSTAAHTTVLFAHDTRESAERLGPALQAGLLTAGVDVKGLGMMPTPVLSYCIRSLAAAAGIIMTASHNPYQYNGIKLFDSEGMKCSVEIEQAIEQQLHRAAQDPHCIQPAHRLGQLEPLSHPTEAYLNFCQQLFSPALSLAGLKLVVDCANGATSELAPTVFRQLGATLLSIHDQPNGTNINQCCGAVDVADLQRAVQQSQADVGLAFDGDGDRLLMVDHQGAVVDGDEILCLLARYGEKKGKPGAGVVGTVMSNIGIEQCLAAAAIPFERAPVGDRPVVEALIQRDWVLGGEPSGHIVNLAYTHTGDGIVTALQILRILQETQQPLQTLKQVMTKYPQQLLNVPLKEKIDVIDHPPILAAIRQGEAQLGTTGRILLRPSGTEPVLRLMVQGEQEPVVRQVSQMLAAAVESCL